MSTATFIPAQRCPLLDEFLRVRNATAALVAPLNAEDMMLQSMPDASPAKWHLAHTTWFFETFILREHLPGYRVFNDDFLRVFNSYYKQIGDHPNRARRGLFSRPTLAEVTAYRQHVEHGVAQLLKREHSAEVESLLVLGMNHEQQHQELIVTDLKHALWSQPLQPAYQDHKKQAIAASPGDFKWIPFRGGIHSIGSSGDSFCFDNETPQHQTLLRPFRLASRLVTNAEYLDFIRSGAYREPSLWLSEGWDTIVREQWDAPLYWERNPRNLDDDSWRVFTLHGWQPLDLAEPVCHVSYFEAEAFARWAGARLPLESEWEVAAHDHAVATRGNFVESGLLHPRPAAENSSSLQQVFGDVWEWTASPYTAYPGFTPAVGAIGEYNGKFMCNQYVLRGGSCATPQSHLRATYRNFFPAHVRWQFSGIRLASDGPTDR